MEVNRISATYSKMDMIKMYMNMYLTIANESLIILHLYLKTENYWKMCTESNSYGMSDFIHLMNDIFRKYRKVSGSTIGIILRVIIA